MPLTRIRQTAIGNDSITSAKLAHDLDLDGDFVRVPHGTTAERPSSPVAGYMRFNTDQGTLEQWNTTTNSWQAIDSPPIITSLAYSGSLTAADPAGGETITLTGTNFKSGATVTIGGTSASSVSVVNSTTITFTTPVKTAGDYDVVVINANGLQATLTNGISYNGTPAFTTAAGNVGSISEDIAMSTITIVAAEPDGGTLAYSITSGALPTGVSMSSVGAITGTPNVNVTSDTTYNFTVTATDDENQTNSRAFNLIVLRPIYATSLDNSVTYVDGKYTSLVRNFPSAGNRLTYTYSLWVKRSTLGTYQNLMRVDSTMMRFINDDRLQFERSGGNVVSAEKFRDTTAFYHIVWAVDSTQATAADRVKLYVNGVEQTLSGTYPVQNTNYDVNNTAVHHIGSYNANGEVFDGYLSDIYFIDGQALAPTAFAEEYYGVWTPKSFSGTYGSNGFHLELDGNSQDTSGNNNHWIPNNLGGSLVKYSGSNLDYPNNLYKVLDGDDSTAAGAQGPNTGTPASIIYTPPTPITVNSSLKFKYNTGQTDCKYKINGGSYVNLSQSGTIDFNTGFTGTLTSIEWYVANSNSLINVYDLRVDDVQVINYDLGYAAVPDSPTNNFATLNPLFKGTSPTLSEGNLKFDSTDWSNSVWGSRSTIAIPKDKKIYIEIENTGQGGANWAAGIATDSSAPSSTNVGGTGSVTVYHTSAYVNGVQTTPGHGGMDPGDILGIAVDGASGEVWFSKNGTWFTTSGNIGDPSAGTDPVGTVTNPDDEDLFLVVAGNATNNDLFVNFGQDTQNISSAESPSNGIGSFEYSVPTGHIALCAKNLSESAINTSIDDRPEDYFNLTKYNGNGTTNNITLGFQPDFVWLKRTDGLGNHVLLDSLRGINRIFTNSNSQQLPGGDGFAAFNSTGFNLDGTGGGGDVNTSGRSYIGYGWKAGGAPTATNSAGAGNVPTFGSVMIDGVASTSALAGTIAADKLSANTKAGFSIIKYTANGSSSQTVAHGLTQTPDFVMVKNTQSTNNWVLWSPFLSSEHTLYPNLTNAMNSSPATWYAGGMTSTTIGFDTAEANPSGGSPVAYCWHSVEGFSKFGTYTGTADANGPTVYTEFKPSYIMVRRYSSTGNWFVLDSKRNPSNGSDGVRLYWDGNGGDSTDNGAYSIDFLANGFKLRSSSNVNASGTYLYMCFAEDPFKYSEAR